MKLNDNELTVLIGVMFQSELASYLIRSLSKIIFSFY